MPSRRGAAAGRQSADGHVERYITTVNYAVVLVNVVIYPHALFGTVRLTGEMMNFFWRAFYVDHPNVIFTSFGSPYLLYEQPHLPNLYLAYGHSRASQIAAVKAWLGELTPTGHCPVKMHPKMGLL